MFDRLKETVAGPQKSIMIWWPRGGLLMDLNFLNFLCLRISNKNILFEGRKVLKDFRFSAIRSIPYIQRSNQTQLLNYTLRPGSRARALAPLCVDFPENNNDNFMLILHIKYFMMCACTYSCFGTLQSQQDSFMFWICILFKYGEISGEKAFLCEKVTKYGSSLHVIKYVHLNFGFCHLPIKVKVLKCHDHSMCVNSSFMLVKICTECIDSSVDFILFLQYY